MFRYRHQVINPRLFDMAKSGGFGRSRFNRDRFNNRGGADNRRDFGGRGGGGGGNRGGNNNGNSRDNFNNKGNYGRPNAYESKDVPMKDNNYGNKGNDYNNRDNFGRDRERTDIHSSGRSRFSDIPKTENTSSRFSNHTDSNAQNAGPRTGSRFQSGGGSRFSNNDGRAPPTTNDSYQNRNKDDHSNSFYDNSSAKYNRPPPAISSAVTQSNTGYQSNQSNQYNYNHQGDTSRPPPPSSNGGNYQYGMPSMYAFPPPPLPTK